jgi:hypothetical protein
VRALLIEGKQPRRLYDVIRCASALGDGMSTSRVYWKNVPTKFLIAFLLGVFLLFSIIGFASDIPEIARQPRLRFVLNVRIAGVFPVFYAFAGFALRKDWWKVVLLIFGALCAAERGEPAANHRRDRDHGCGEPGL